MSDNAATRVVAAIDFGTTFSGFAYAHRSNPREIVVHDGWQEYIGCLNLKTPTVLKYDESFNLTSWGYPALSDRPNKKKPTPDIKPVKRFKLHLSKMENKPYIPSGIKYKKAIVDYLREMGKVMKDTLKIRWPNLEYFKQVLIIMTVPAEFDREAIGIMRKCAFKAGITNDKNSRHLKFTTEPEAAAIHCMKLLKELDVGVGSSFLVVDCGGGTVDLTTRKLLAGQKLGEITERKGDFCGGSFVDDEFIEFLGRKVGSSAIKLLMENNDSQLQYMIQEFCRRIKFPFTGQRTDFKPYNLDLEDLCPIIKKYVKGTEHELELEKAEWTIELKFEDVEKMFDPVIEKILRLIRAQLDASDNVSAMLLVGGFSESKYLQTRIKQEFDNRLQNKISVPAHPMTAIVKGAVQFGLRQEVVVTRVLKWTYGTDVVHKWKPNDSLDRKLPGGMVLKFSRLAERGDEVPVDAVVPRIFSPGFMLQNQMGLDIYITDKQDSEYCDSPDVKLLGNWTIDVPITFSDERPILFLLTFGEIEIEATAFNLETGDRYDATFELDI